VNPEQTFGAISCLLAWLACDVWGVVVFVPSFHAWQYKYLVLENVTFS
jgi:hypothetical protein